MANLEGMKIKHVVIKIEDYIKYVKSPFKAAMLNNDLEDIEKGRKADGKNPKNTYLVINTDEPHADQIIEIMKANGHWG